jgi:predicted transcriptional regulator
MKNLMEVRARTIRREVKSRQWKLGRRGYPREVRELVVGYAEARQRQGARPGMIARELGMAVQTIQNWLGGRDEKRQARAEENRWRQVRVEVQTEDEGTVERVTLVTPQGYRIEGLQVGEVVEVLRRLK